MTISTREGNEWHSLAIMFLPTVESSSPTATLKNALCCERTRWTWPWSHSRRISIGDCIRGRGQPQVCQLMVRNAVKWPCLSRLALLCGNGVLMDGIKVFVSGPVHQWLYNILQSFLVDLSGSPHALGEEKPRHSGPFVENGAKDQDKGRKDGVSYDGHLLDGISDSPVVLLVVLLVFIKVLFIIKEPDHSGGPDLELVE